MRQEKEDLMSIGEVSKVLNITRRIILNYEDKGLLTADFRGENESGNRYYTADSVTRIRTIRILQNLGLSLDEIYSYYNGTNDMELLITRLEKLRDELNLNIEKLKERAKDDCHFEIQTITIPAQTIYRKTIRTNTIEDKKNILRETFLVALRQYGSDTSKRMFFIEYPMNDPDLVSYCIAIPPNSQGEHVYAQSEETALSLFYHGDYETIPPIREQMVQYATKNNICLKGTARHIYLEGPPQHNTPSKFITQIALLIE